MYMMMKVPRGTIDEELAVVCAELDAQPSPVYVPRLLMKLGLHTIVTAEKNLSIDCGPTAGIDAAISARNQASENDRTIVSWNDLRSAIHTCLCTHKRQSSENFPEDRMDALIPDIAGFLQKELSGIDLGMLIANLHACIGSTGAISPENLKKLVTCSPPEPELEKLSAWVVQHEKIYNYRIYEVIAEYLKAYQHGIAQLKNARGRIQKKTAPQGTSTGGNK